MDLQIISLCVTVFFCVVCGLLVLLSPQVRLNRRIAFATCQLGLTVWVVNLYLSNVSSPYSLLLNRAVYAGPLIGVMAFGFFINMLAEKSSVRTLYYQIIGGVGGLAILISVSSGTVQRINPRYGANGTFEGYSIIAGPLAKVMLLLVLLLLAVVVYRTYRVYRGVVASKDKRALRIVLRGLLITVGIVSISNLLLPILTPGSLAANNLGTLSLLFFVGSFAYGLLRHNFLEVRLLVVRALAYVLSLSTLAVLLLLLILGVSSSVLDQMSLQAQRAFFVFVAIVMALAYQPVKRFFDKVTNKLFYQDAYDSQLFLDQLNQTLLSTIELEKLLSLSARLIQETLKVDFCAFGIKEVNGRPRRIIGDVTFEISEKEIKHLRAFTVRSRSKVLVVDDVADGHADIRELLRHNQVALLTRLAYSPQELKEGLGYIVLGAKKSGNQFSRQDIQVLEIITDELTIAIQNALRFEEIENFNFTLQQKVEDATRKLRQTNEKLKALDETKDEFISMASHQLRTPLTSMKGYVSMVLEGDAGKLNRLQKQMLNQAFVSSQRMVFLIADLLNVSRLKTGKFIIEAKPTSLSKVVEEEVNQLIETAKSRDVKLTYDAPDNFPMLALDETKIRQVVMNFIDNAIYYTPPKGHIRVRLEDKAEAVEFTVNDNGIGVPKHEQHHLFTKFYRANNAKKARPDGTGLGLFMAKKVVVAQGGAILFTSREGKGSTFGFSFPKAKLQVRGQMANSKMRLPARQA